MHTLKVIAIGFAVLVACSAAGYFTSGATGLSRAALIFLPVWAIGAGINMYLGVKRAGYSIAALITPECSSALNTLGTTTGWPVSARNTGLCL
jgi:hypothetical protein